MFLSPSSILSKASRPLSWIVNQALGLTGSITFGLADAVHAAAEKITAHFSKEEVYISSSDSFYEAMQGWRSAWLVQAKVNESRDRNSLYKGAHSPHELIRELYKHLILRVVEVSAYELSPQDYADQIENLLSLYRPQLPKQYQAVIDDLGALLREFGHLHQAFLEKNYRKYQQEQEKKSGPLGFVPYGVNWLPHEEGLSLIEKMNEVLYSFESDLESDFVTEAATAWVKENPEKAVLQAISKVAEVSGSGVIQAINLVKTVIHAAVKNPRVTLIFTLAASTTMARAQTTAAFPPGLNFLSQLNISNFAEAKSIALTPDGGFAVGGGAYINGDSNSYDMLLSNHYPNGTVQWARTFGGAAYDGSHGLAITADGGFAMTGQTTSFGAADHDILLVKFAPDGTLQWANKLTGTTGAYNDDSLAIVVTNATDPNSDLVIAGIYSAASDNGDALLAKFNSQGNLLWTRALSGPSGNDKNDYYEALAVTSDGSLIAAGLTGSFDRQNNHILISKFDSSGNFQWGKGLGGVGVGLDYAYGIALDFNGNGFAITGQTDRFNTNSDVLIAKFTNSGDLVWARRLAGNDYDKGTAIVATPDGGFVLAGQTTSFGNGYNQLLAKFSAGGDLLWAQVLKNNIATDSGLVLTQTGGFSIAGTIQDLTSGLREAFLAQLDPEGQLAGCNVTQTIFPAVTNITSVIGTQIIDIAASFVSDVTSSLSIQSLPASNNFIDANSLFPCTPTLTTGSTGSSGSPSTGTSSSVTTQAQTTITFPPALNFMSRITSGTRSEAYGIAMTLDDGFALGGLMSNSNNSHLTTEFDLLLTNHHANGTLRWARTFGGTGYDSSNGMAVTPDGGFVMTGQTTSFGTSYHDILVVEFGANGDLQWANKLSGGAITDNDSFAIVVTNTSDPNSDLAISGYYQDNPDGNGGDALLAKFNRGGSLLWAKGLGGGSNNQGDRYQALAVTSDGSFIAAGLTGSFPAGEDHLLLSKFSRNGDYQWGKSLGGMGGNNFDSAFAIALDFNNNGFAITGYTTRFSTAEPPDNYDLLIAKFSNQGNLLWARRLSGSRYEKGTAIVATLDGGFVVVGETTSFEAAYNVLIAKFSNNGSLQWARVLKNGAGQGYETALAMASDGSIAIGGAFLNVVTGTNDVLVARLDAQGQLAGCNNVLTIFPNVTDITSTIGEMVVDIPSSAVSDVTGSLSVQSVSAPDNFIAMNNSFVCTPTLTTGSTGTSGSTSTGSTGSTQSSGSSGSIGTSGTSRTSGSSGSVDTSGTSRTSGSSGSVGTSGTSHTSGSSGSIGTSGTSRTSGSSGSIGTSGTSRTSGSSGSIDTSGTSDIASTSDTSAAAFSTTASLATTTQTPFFDSTSITTRLTTTPLPQDLSTTELLSLLTSSEPPSTRVADTTRLGTTHSAFSTGNTGSSGQAVTTKGSPQSPPTPAPAPDPVPAPSPSPTTPPWLPSAIGGGVAGLVCLSAAIAAGIAYSRYLRKRKQALQRSPSTRQLLDNRDNSVELQPYIPGQEGIAGKVGPYHLLRTLDAGAAQAFTAATGRTLQSAANNQFSGCLGRGNFGTVWLAQHEDTLSYFAIKEIVGQGVMQSEQETQIQKSLEHPHILPILLDWEGPNREQQTRFLVVPLARCDGLTMAKQLSQNIPNARAREARLISMSIDLLKAISYMHSQGIYHLDIKPSNVLFGPDWQVYLSDFGTAIREKNTAITCGDVNYYSPERIACWRGTEFYLQTQQGYFSSDICPSYDATQGDMYAFGLTLLEMFCNRHPYFGQTLPSRRYEYFCTDTAPSLESINHYGIRDTAYIRCPQGLYFVDTKTIAVYEIKRHTLSVLPALPTLDKLLGTPSQAQKIQLNQEQLKALYAATGAIYHTPHFVDILSHWDRQALAKRINHFFARRSNDWGISPELRNILWGLLKVNPQERLDAKTALQQLEALLHNRNKQELTDSFERVMTPPPQRRALSSAALTFSVLQVEDEIASPELARV